MLETHSYGDNQIPVIANNPNITNPIMAANTAVIGSENSFSDNSMTLIKAKVNTPKRTTPLSTPEPEIMLMSSDEETLSSNNDEPKNVNVTEGIYSVYNIDSETIKVVTRQEQTTINVQKVAEEQNTKIEEINIRIDNISSGQSSVDIIQDKAISANASAITESNRIHEEDKAAQAITDAAQSTLIQNNYNAIQDIKDNGIDLDAGSF